MPAITRWFRVTHDINGDPEMWELREKFGDRAGFVWLEILSIADRNNGFLGPSSPQLHTVLAGKCRVYSPKVRSILEWCLGRSWLELRNGLYVSKWAKYNKRRDADKRASETTPRLDNTKQPRHKPPLSPKRGQMVDDLTFNKFWQSYPRKEGKDAAYKAWCKEAKHFLDVQSAIFEALTWQVGQPQWTRDGGQYIPHPATYLNQGRWKDKPVEVSVGRKQPEPKGFEALRQFQAIRDRQVR